MGKKLLAAGLVAVSTLLISAAPAQAYAGEDYLVLSARDVLATIEK